jgi:hypothetical protein
MAGTSEAIDAGPRAAELVPLLAAGLGEPDPDDRPRASRLGGWVTRLLASEAAPRPWEVFKLRRMDDGGFFRRWQIAMVFVFGEPRLEGAMLPSRGSFGVFALATSGGPRGPDGGVAAVSRALYLSRRRRHFAEVLRSEGRSLAEASPSLLAAIVMEALGRRGDAGHVVVEAAGQIKGFGYHYGADGYEADMRELRRCAASVEPARIAEDDGGWSLTCCTVYGPEHDKRALLRHEVRVRRGDGAITLRSHALSRAIFRRVPDLVY